MNLGRLNRAVRRAATRAPAQQRSYRQGVVTAVNVGPPKTVSFKFTSTDTVVHSARYFKHYVPTVGDTIEIELRDGDPLVRGTLA